MNKNTKAKRCFLSFPILSMEMTAILHEKYQYGPLAEDNDRNRNNVGSQFLNPGINE
ncbi:hypothetical protein [Sphingobacterium faecium]